MSRAQSPTKGQSPPHTTEEMLGRMMAQMEALTISFNALMRENDNRIEEISKLAKKVGCSGEIKTDKENIDRPEETNDSSSKKDQEEKQAQENLRLRNEKIFTQSSVRFPAPSAPHAVEEEKVNAKTMIETIRGINGQDDMGVEDFIKTVKRAKIHCTQQKLLLNLVIAKKITAIAERAIRYIQIDSYEDLFEALH